MLKNLQIINPENTMRSIQTETTLRQTIVKANSNEELFNLLKRAIGKNPTRVIITPRVDVAQNAYYWIGVRFGNRELDFKLAVNEEIKSYLRDYMVGIQIGDLPEVTNFKPEQVEDVQEWLTNNMGFHKLGALKTEELLTMRDGVNYLYSKYTLMRGRIYYPSTKVDDVLSLVE